MCVSSTRVAIWTPSPAPATDDAPTTSAGPGSDVSERPLPQCPDGGGRHDREERRGGGLYLPEPERDERRHEQDPAADAEHAGEDAGRETERQRGDDRPGAHAAISHTAMAARRPANASVSTRPETRCWSPVPTTAPAMAGTPTSAAYPTSTSPCAA